MNGNVSLTPSSSLMHDTALTTEREEIVKEQSIVAGRASKSTPLFSPAPPEPHNSDLRRSSRGKGLESILKSVTANNRRSSTETVKSDATRMEDSPSGELVLSFLISVSVKYSEVYSWRGSLIIQLKGYFQYSKGDLISSFPIIR